MSDPLGDLVLVNARELARISEALRRVPGDERPALARRLLLVALQHIRPDTGLVEVSASDLAARLQTDVSTLSRAVTALENLGALRRERERRLAGRALYYVNPFLGRAADPGAYARWSPLGGDLATWSNDTRRR